MLRLDQSPGIGIPMRLTGSEAPIRPIREYEWTAWPSFY